MIGAFFAVMLAQASLPPPGLRYFSRTEFAGPGLVCGAAFSIHLRNDERAVLRKSIAIVSDMDFYTHEGQFTIHESQYATEGGKVIRKVAGGEVRRKRRNGQLIFIYENSAPGSTDVFGPALNGSKREAVLKRIVFGGPRSGKVDGEPCIIGRSFGEQTT